MPLFEKIVPSKNNKLELMDKVWTKVKPEDKEEEIIARLMRLVNAATNAMACSLLLYDDKRQELYFKFAQPAVQPAKRLHVARQSGITAWIMKNGKTMLVNNAEKNANYHKRIDHATGFKTKAIIGVPLMMNNKVAGVIEVLNKETGAGFSQQDLDIVVDLAASAAVTLQNIRMNAELIHSYKGTVKALVSLADSKETISGVGHSRRVAEYVLMGANELALSKEAKQNIEYAAILHDIGKLSISDEILNKAGPLTEEEWGIIRKHPVVGYNMLRDIPFLKGAARLILYHHERYDGGGYPQGLQGKEIPLEARLIAVADAFDAMTTEHNHRQAMDHHKAFSELTKNIRSQFCPIAVKAFSDGFAKTRLNKIKGAYIPKSFEFLTALPAAEHSPKSQVSKDPQFKVRQPISQLSKTPKV
ncbi:MAG: HD domain-containing phosphohydrolase [Dehalococcoidales bacterium]|jgi:HD-GYP domain-containing protein (c-di-GMP phosphodiesterase class II)